MAIKKYGNIMIAFRKDTADESVLQHSFKNDIFLKNVPEYIPNSSDIIIDIGAHIGTFTVLAAKCCKKGKVYAIEPCEDSFKYLKRNVELNNLKNVNIYKIALSDKEGKTKLFYHTKSGNWGHSITREFSDSGEEVLTATLSNFIKENNIKHCNLCKVNCEGAEFKIFLNTSKDILQIFDVIVILYHLDLVDNYSESDLIDHLTKCDFTIRIANKKNERGWIIAINNNCKVSQLRIGINKLKIRIREIIYKSLSGQRKCPVNPL